MYNTPFHTRSIADLKFLVTGGAGFIGSNLVEYLLKHNAGGVTVLDNFSTGFKKNLTQLPHQDKLTILEGDIRNLEDCQKALVGVDYVFHQAALGSVPRSIDDPITTNSVNVSGFLNVLVAAKDAKVKRLVYAASSSVYGDSPILPKKEEIIGAPLSPYAVSKYVNELYASVFGKVYGLTTVGLRYFNVFGPRQNPDGVYAAVIPLFVRTLIKGEAPIINGDGSHTRDFTFVENVVKANILAALEAPETVSGELFNIACGDRTNLNQLVAILGQNLGSPIEPIHGPERVGDIHDSLADISKATQFLGYQPVVGVLDGLRITTEYFSKIFKQEATISN